MLFNTPLYLFVFLPICFFGFVLAKRHPQRTFALSWLLLASLVFYAYWNPPYLALLVGTILFNFAAAKYFIAGNFGPRSRKAALCLGIIANLLPLFFYKYVDFALQIVSSQASPSFSLASAVLPLAISFFTFQQIAYLIDTYKSGSAEESLLHYALFVSFFPQLIAGPIVHHSEISPQLRGFAKARITLHSVSHGMALIGIGLFKKSVLADSLSLVVDSGYNNALSLSATDAWICAIGFTFQIYYDFSGYTDIARGSARLFNIDLPINFDSPYKSLSISKFWKHWHITLSRWFFKYLYIPLGGNRNGFSRASINILIVFALSGLWHGAGWTFIIWGVAHGLAVLVNKAWEKAKTPLPGLLAWPLTFGFLCLTWVFFRSPDVATALTMIAKMIGLEDSGSSVSFHSELASQSVYFLYHSNFITNTTELIPLEAFFAVAALTFLLPSSHSLGAKLAYLDRRSPSVFLSAAVVIGLTLGIAITFMLANKGSSFIYFNF
ncbi:MBOAT family O-acyltransferase [Pelagicoccus sp. SDUM812003]|uniref:MBOAT family O-acyltransferase n=1 Tax=Pelagicoccus sp. SDUM812003 TaxID=3041267 RepID=UPI00280D86C3|nr:MBOAT family O-acyltransferase [Pelagicoccus sp. SDUM812003]MDQ8202509.1 MBOAT family O-acyltransferase [Pelagicoccus sp. SDUM812003]